MKRPNETLPVPPAVLVGALCARFRTLGIPDPMVEALTVVERAARHSGETLPDVAGMPWVRYRSYAVAMDAVRVELRALCELTGRALLAELAVIGQVARSSGGLVEAGVLAWAEVPDDDVDRSWVATALIDSIADAFGPMETLDPQFDRTA